MIQLILKIIHSNLTHRFTTTQEMYAHWSSPTREKNNFIADTQRKEKNKKSLIIHKHDLYCSHIDETWLYLSKDYNYLCF